MRLKFGGERLEEHNKLQETTMSDNIVTAQPSEQSAERADPSTEFVVRHIAWLPLLALPVILANFAIFYSLFT